MISLNGGYAMIKYNSTQEELQIAYRSKKPVLCYDENRRAHWAVIEETATESVDEETQEPITIYKYSYRLIDEASGGGATLDDIVDSQGNKRFVEGVGTFQEVSGVTLKYNKWSLSGTHFMIVFAFENSASITNNTILLRYTLPEYIMNKIVGIQGSDLVAYLTVTSMDASVTNVRFYLEKVNDEIRLRNGQSISADKIFRVQFDLLIDVE